MSSIRDVARHAGVSVATVSKVINNYPDVSRKTANRVMNSIDQLEYRPNVTARGLVKKRSWTIGLFLQDVLSNPFVSQLLEGMNEALRNSGYDMIYLSMMSDAPSYSFTKHCLSRNVDGIVSFGLSKDLPSLNELILSDIPTMFIDSDLLGRRSGYITSDNRNGAAIAMEHLAQLGHRKIAYITGDLNYIAGKERFEGYRQGLQTHGLPYISSYVEYGYFASELSYKAMQRLLKQDDPPTAVVCASDIMAIAAIHAALDSGVRVPAQLSVVGFDNTNVAGLVRPGLTTVNQNVPAIGRKAIEQVIAMIQDPDYAPPVMIEPVDLVVRGTTGPPPGR
jgi:LacI family transcriptional regulator